MTKTMIQRCDEAVSQLWQVYYLTTTRDDANTVLDAIIKIKELPCFDYRRNEDDSTVEALCKESISIK